MDGQKKKLIEKFFNYLKDPDGNFYDTNFKEDLMAIRGDRVAAIFPDSDDADGNFNPQKKGYEFDEYLEALVQGIPKGMLSTWEQEKTSNVPLLIRGLGKKSQLAIKNCWEKQQTFYAIDSGYLGNERTKSKVWHRITKNALQHLGPIKDRANDRMNKIGYKYLKFHPGSKILICPPSDKVMKFWDQPTPEEWTQQTIKELKRYTDRPIEVRLKPKRNERIADGNIVHALQNDVHCVVTYNSIAATEALLNGKPAIALGPNAATVLCNTSLSEVENLNTFDKLTIEGYAAHLTYCQFTKQEMQNGIVDMTVAGAPYVSFDFNQNGSTCESGHWGSKTNRSMTPINATVEGPAISLNFTENLGGILGRLDGENYVVQKHSETPFTIIESGSTVVVATEAQREG